MLLEISGIECCLLVFIDDATSKITAMHLSKEETLEAYLTTLKQHIQQYGCFKSLYLDRSAVAKARVGNNHTQFARALMHFLLKLKIKLKEQIEPYKIDLSKQDRFVKYLKEKKIQTIEEANLGINDFIQMYNKKFGVNPRSSVDLHHL